MRPVRGNSGLRKEVRLVVIALYDSGDLKVRRKRSGDTAKISPAIQPHFPVLRRRSLVLMCNADCAHRYQRLLLHQPIRFRDQAEAQSRCRIRSPALQSAAHVTVCEYVTSNSVTGHDVPQAN
jgi:hypothetical protein